VSSICYRKRLSNSDVSWLSKRFPSVSIEGAIVHVGSVSILRGMTETTVFVPEAPPFARVVRWVVVAGFAVLGLAVGTIASDATPAMGWLATTAGGAVIGLPIALALHRVARRKLETFGERVGVAVGSALYRSRVSRDSAPALRSAPSTLTAGPLPASASSAG
jgi:hypothetical protein